MRAAGFAFDVDPADIDETEPAGLSIDAAAAHLALAKARHVALRHPDAVVLGADTIVDVEGTSYGKAATADEARAILRAQFGKRQRVVTGVAIVRPDNAPPVVESVVSEVAMRPMSDDELEAYVAGNQWRGKAGAYGLQDHDPASDPFVRLVSGTFSNVVGLPIERVVDLLARVGVRPGRAR
jgi:septum formation protein